MATYFRRPYALGAWPLAPSTAPEEAKASSPPRAKYRSFGVVMGTAGLVRTIGGSVCHRSKEEVRGEGTKTVQNNSGVCRVSPACVEVGGRVQRGQTRDVVGVHQPTCALAGAMTASGESLGLAGVATAGRVGVSNALELAPAPAPAPVPVLVLAPVLVLDTPTPAPLGAPVPPVTGVLGAEDVVLFLSRPNTLSTLPPKR